MLSGKIWHLWEQNIAEPLNFMKNKNLIQKKFLQLSHVIIVSYMYSKKITRTAVIFSINSYQTNNWLKN